MATNTFASTREAVFRPRPKTSYTFNIVMLPGTRRNDFRTTYTHGTLGMTGWVRDSGGTPQRRVVLLKIQPANEVIARTVSDPANVGNNYFFNGLRALDANESYALEVHNEDYATTAPRIKDNRVPV